MYLFYNFIVLAASQLLKIAALFSPKLSLFVRGRKNVIPFIKSKISANDNTIWMHVASLGEFEQGLPILEKLKENYPSYKLIVTFFSPSGYEVKKNNTMADVICYLPLDTKKNALQFIAAINPKLVLFVKYEIWPNYLKELKNRTIPTLLFSAFFKKNQIYFKSYGGFMRKSLSAFNHIFVQDITSKDLLENINYTNTSICGDTRFDRVAEILNANNSLDFMTQFKGDSLCFVAGSTWAEDEALLIDYINKASSAVKFVIAPHNIKEEHIIQLRKTIKKKTICYTEINKQDISKCNVLILDTIGILTKVYSYADVAYVGGAFKTGLHNTLEPAVFGIPVLIGPQFTDFKEAIDLVALKGVISISDSTSFSKQTTSLLDSLESRLQVGSINSNYIESNTGASMKILKYIDTILSIDK